MTEKPIKDKNKDNDLKLLLLWGCVPTPKGERSIQILAANLGLHYMTPYRWIETNTIPLNQAKHIIRANNLFWVLMNRTQGHITNAQWVADKDFAPYIKG